MFSTHTITSKTPKVRNAVLLFMSIVLGLGSVAVRAAQDAISIDTNISNAVQTIMKIIVTSNGTQGGTTGVVIDGAAGEITIAPSMVSDGNNVERILGLDSNGRVITVITGAVGGTNISTVTGLIDQQLITFSQTVNNLANYYTITTITGLLNSLWTLNGTNMYNSNGSSNVNIGGGAGGTYLARLEVDSNASNALYLKENTAIGATAIFKDSSTTGWMLLGNGTNFSIGKYIGTTNTPLLRVYGNGNVGIGTIPTQQLDIYDAAGGTYRTEGIRVTRGSVPGQYGIINNYGGALRIGAIVNGGGAAGEIYFDRHNASSGTPTTSMVINSVGNVGIGTGTPSQRLEVIGNIKLPIQSWIGAATKQIYFNTTINTILSGALGINQNTPGEALDVNGNIKLSSAGASYIQLTSANGWIGASTGQITFGGGANKGNVGIGISSPSQALTVSGNIQMNNGNWMGSTATNKMYFTGGNIGIGTDTPSYTVEVRGSASADHWYMNSDKRLKKDIVVMNDSLDKILSLNGYYFTFKKNNEKSIGVIAQEVEAVFPQIVNTASDGIKAVSYSNLVAPLIEAVKALNAKITQVWNLYFDQQQQINQLEQRIQTLENKLP